MAFVSRCAWLPLAAGLFTAAQAQQVTGTVLSDDGEALAGAQVLALELDRGTVTDGDGRFTLELPAAVVWLEARYVGFEPARERVDTRAGGAEVAFVLRRETVGLDAVTVTGEADPLVRAPQAVEVLDAAALARLRGQTLGETLEGLPGVTTLTTGPGIAKPVVRGLHSQRLLVLNAGVAQEGQQWGGEHAPEIDPFAPARVEVVKGAAAVEYGPGALGGVVRVEPRPIPDGGPVAGELALQAFSNNRQGAGSLLLEGGVPGAAGVGWQVRGSARRAGAAAAPGYRLANTGFAELDAAAGLGYHRGRWGLDAYASRFQTTLGLYTGAHINNAADLLRAAVRGEPAEDAAFSYAIGRPRQEVTHDLATLRGHFSLATGDRLEAQYGLQRNHRQEFDAHRGDASGRPAFDLTLTTHAADVRLRHRPVGHLVGALGLSGSLQTNANGRSGFLIPNFRAWQGGAWAHETFLAGRWTLEAGARFDARRLRAWPEEGGRFVPRYHTWAAASGVLGALYEIDGRWSLGLSAGTAWRPPGVNELYADGVHHGTAQYERGDPALGAERSLGVSATLRHRSARADGELSVFRNAIADYLYLRPRTNAAGELAPVQTIRGAYFAADYAQTDAVLAGVDGAVSWRAAERLTLGAAGSLVRGTDRTADAPLYGMPQDRLTLRAAWALPALGRVPEHEVEVEGTFVRRQDRVAPGTEVLRDEAGRNVLAPPPGYALLGLAYHATVRLAGHDARLSLAAHNVLDTAHRDYLDRYRYYVDAPGRTVSLRLTVPFGA